MNSECYDEITKHKDSVDHHTTEVLSPCARRILRVVDQRPGCHLDVLMEACGGELRRTRETLQTLLHMGYLERQQQDGETVYVTTVV